jgi:F-type H+-transporting ATPase subunit delta
MPRKFNARRYARAVLEIALERKELDRWRTDFAKVVEVLGDETILAVMESPKIKLEDKSRLLGAPLAGISPLALNLVMMLVARGHANMAPEIAAAYGHLVDDYRGIESAEVVTAIPLDKTDEEHLARELGGMTGKKVQLKSSIDPAIIGGIVARVGGKLLDGSTRSKLLALKKELASGGRAGG